MVKQRLITTELHIGEVDDEELSIVLRSVLPRGAQFRDNEVEYRTMEDNWVLSLKYYKGKIAEALTGPAITSELEGQIRTAIEEALLEPMNTKVYRWIMFSQRPVEGHWRYRDQFQIVPAPPEAPRAKEPMTEHPFIVDFVFNDSPHDMVRQYRCARKASDLTFLLNLLLVPRITAPSNPGRKHWVWAPEGSEAVAMWAQEGYMIPNFHHLVDDFPNIPGVLPLEEVAAETYYDRIAGRSDTLTIPAELVHLIDAFNGLNGDDRERYLRASFWYHTALTVWQYSQSLHFMSLINAIECLASLGPERSIPQGPSTLFKSFMQEFAPGRPSGARLDHIYDVRGEITHGERLLYLNHPAQSFGLNQKSTIDREIDDVARILCRGALINWLWSRNLTAVNPLLAKGLQVILPARSGTKSGVIVTIPDSKSANGRDH